MITKQIPLFIYSFEHIDFSYQVDINFKWHYDQENNPDQVKVRKTTTKQQSKKSNAKGSMNKTIAQWIKGGL